MDLKLRRLRPDQVEAAHAVIVAAAGDLAGRRGRRRRPPPDPLARLRADAADRAVYAVTRGETVATFTLGTSPPTHGDAGAALWRDPAARAFYVNRLAVHPEHQGDDIGRWCLTTIEWLAHGAHCDTVRLHTHAAPAPAIRLYERSGYERRGALGPPENAAIYFEKNLTPSLPEEASVPT